MKSAEDRKAATAVSPPTTTGFVGPSAIGSQRQRANAVPGEPGGNAKAMPAWANDLPQAAPDNPADAKADNETQLVAADQLNDVDRALREGNAPATTVGGGPGKSAAPAPAAASSQESSTWDQTSLIGKIFIGFGALLTMASAARMFIA